MVWSIHLFTIECPFQSFLRYECYHSNLELISTLMLLKGSLITAGLQSVGGGREDRCEATVYNLCLGIGTVSVTHGTVYGNRGTASHKSYKTHTGFTKWRVRGTRAHVVWQPDCIVTTPYKIEPNKHARKIGNWIRRSTDESRSAGGGGIIENNILHI